MNLNLASDLVRINQQGEQSTDIVLPDGRTIRGQVFEAMQSELTAVTVPTLIVAAEHASALRQGTAIRVGGVVYRLGPKPQRIVSALVSWELEEVK